jgi:UPF0716 protein FxsA
MLLIEIGSRIGTFPTLGVIVVTGVVGATLARHEGLQVLRRIQAELAQGQLPAGALVDGMIILMAGALLITPGVLTDALGFLCLVPGCRDIVKKVVRKRLERAVRHQRVHVSVHVGDFRDPHEPGAGYDLGVRRSDDDRP